MPVWELHAPLIEVLVRLLTVLNSTGKGGVTTAALYTNKNAYSLYATLFKDAVSKGRDLFMRVCDRAQEVRKAQGPVYMPLTAGLSADISESHRSSQGVRNSVLEAIEPPPRSRLADADTHQEDPLGLQQSLSAFMERRAFPSVERDTGRSSFNRSNQEHVPFKTQTPNTRPIQKRVVFH